MSEYESSMHLNKSDRTWNYVGLVIATTTLIAFRNSVRVARRYDGYIPLGNKNLFYSSDRDPEDRRLI